MMERRDFIKNTCRICLLGASGVALADLAGCSPAGSKVVFKPDVTNNTVTVPLTMFAEKNLQIISPKKYPYEIAIEKSGANYKALLLRCTHFSNQLTPTGSGYLCTLHGSKFDHDGKVLNGPAEQPLQELRTEIIQDQLQIKL